MLQKELLNQLKTNNLLTDEEKLDIKDQENNGSKKNKNVKNADKDTKKQDPRFSQIEKENMELFDTLKSK